MDLIIKNGIFYEMCLATADPSAENHPCRTETIAKKLNLNANDVKFYLDQLAHDGLLVKQSACRIEKGILVTKHGYSVSDTGKHSTDFAVAALEIDKRLVKEGLCKAGEYADYIIRNPLEPDDDRTAIGQIVNNILTGANNTIDSDTN